MNLKTSLSKLVFLLVVTIYRTKVLEAKSSLAIRLDSFSTLEYSLSIDQNIFSPNANPDPKPISSSSVDFEATGRNDGSYHHFARHHNLLAYRQEIQKLSKVIQKFNPMIFESTKTDKDKNNLFLGLLQHQDLIAA